MLDGAEVLIDEPLARRGRAILYALASAMPKGSTVTGRYAGAHRLLVLYGVGLPRRLAARREHLERGGHVATWDLGYWDRENAMRTAVDHLHPSAAQLALAPAIGCRHRIELREDASPDGPILLAGLGDKSAVMFGFAALEWERGAIAGLRERFPGKRIRWRPKGKSLAPLAGTEAWRASSIEEALRGCSLVVCRHSNVAIDACIAGIPVECEDGAALALYQGNRNPSAGERAEFLRRLGWFNWRPSEAREAWDWMRRLIE